MNMPKGIGQNRITAPHGAVGFTEGEVIHKSGKEVIFFSYKDRHYLLPKGSTVGGSAYNTVANGWSDPFVTDKDTLIRVVSVYPGDARNFAEIKFEIIPHEIRWYSNNDPGSRYRFPELVPVFDAELDLLDEEDPEISWVVLIREY